MNTFEFKVIDLTHEELMQIEGGKPGLNTSFGYDVGYYLGAFVREWTRWQPL